MPDTTRTPRARAVLAVAILAVVAALSATAAGAQSWKGKGRISGVVSGPDGQPLAGAHVTLRNAEGQGPDALVTDKKGKWSYLGLVGADWTVHIEADGYVPSEGSVRVNEFGNLPPIQIQLRAVEKVVVKEDPAVAAVARGNELLTAEKYAEARAEYEKALPLVDEKHKNAVLRGIARTYFQEGQKDKAIATLESALAAAPDDVETLRLIINLLVAQGREKDAEVYIARLPAGSTVDPDTLLNLGITHYNAGQLPEALEEFDRVVRENPNLAHAYYYRGLVHLGMGNTAGAKADFEQSLALDPQHPNAAALAPSPGSRG